MRRLLMWIVVLVSVSVLGGVVHGLASDRGLNALGPEQPDRYLELGEMMLLDDASDGDRALGMELLVRAVFWGDQQGQAGVASSGCIALTELVSDESTRSWLWDLALLLDPSRELEWLRMRSMQSDSTTKLELDAARCVYAIRYHQQPLGSNLFAQPSIRERILEAGDEAGIDRAGLVRLLELEIQRGREDSCRGRLYIAERGSVGVRVACPDHLRGLGMCGNDDELRMLLRVEMALAGVEVESWAAASSMSMDGAINLPTVAELVRRMRVEPGKAFYRDGRWVTMP